MTVLNVKALVGAFNQEKALVGGAFSVIVKTGCATDGALHSTTHNIVCCGLVTCHRGHWRPAEVLIDHLH